MPNTKGKGAKNRKAGERQSKGSAQRAHAIAWAQRLTSPSSELRPIAVGVTEIPDEGVLTNGAKTQDTAGSSAK